VPAAAVIPAPIAYIKVVAVKKLVVGFWGEEFSSFSLFQPGLPGWCALAGSPFLPVCYLLLLTE